MTSVGVGLTSGSSRTLCRRRLDVKMVGPLAIRILTLMCMLTISLRSTINKFI